MAAKSNRAKPAAGAKKKHPGSANLRVPTSEQAREYGRKGGIRSAEVKKQRKTASETIKMILDQQPTLPAGTAKMLERLGLTEKNPELRTVGMAALVSKMLAGDLKAIELVLKLSGEMPKDFAITNIIESDNVVLDKQETQRRLDKLTDKELMQYEKLCGKITAEEVDGV